MGDYIKIEDAAIAFSVRSPYCYEDCLNDLIGSIADGTITLEDVAPVVHARWDDSLDGITPFCTACGCTHRCLIRKPLYCPNCGAKMDKEGT